MATVFCLALARDASAVSVTATWNPNPEPDVAGYVLSYGTQSGSYTTALDVGKVTTKQIDLAPARYFFVIQAYNTNQLMSPRSTEVSIDLTSTTAPVLLTLTPSAGSVGTSVTITGTNLGAAQGSSVVTFNGTAATATSWSATQVMTAVPSGATSGAVQIVVGGAASNGLPFTIQPPAGTVTLRQHRSFEGNNKRSGTLAFVSNTQAADLIAVAIRASSPNQQFTVTDTLANAYQRAATINIGTDSTLAVFYAQNAAAGSTSVTVRTSASPQVLRFAILEYAGLAASSVVDVTAAGQGNSAAPATAAATTGSNGDLLFSAVASANPRTMAAGAGFLSQETVPAAPNTKLMVEDRLQPLAGAISSGASLNSSDQWGAILVAFRAANGTVPANRPPTLTQPANQTSTAGNSVSLQLSGSDPDGTAVTYSATGLPPNLSVDANSGLISGTLMSTSAGTYNVTATVSDGALSASRSFTWTVNAPTSTAPTLTSLSPASGIVGAAVTINGTNFGASQGTSVVRFNGISTTASSWSATRIVAPVPQGATTGPVVVTVGGVASNGLTFTVDVPTGSISLLQHRNVQTSCTGTLAFTNANQTGSLVAVVVRASFPDQAFTVTDTRGNAYVQAVRLNDGTDNTLAVFYALNVTAGANTVSVACSQAPGAILRFAVLEYSGVAASGALDGAAAAQGTSAAPSSGAVTTTSSGDLLIGAITTFDPSTMTAGASFAARDSVQAAPNTKLTVEDRIQTAAGAAAATAALSASDQWAAAIVAFKPASSSMSTLVAATGTQQASAVAGARPQPPAASRRLRSAGDFDGDGKDDPATFDPEAGVLTLLPSSLDGSSRTQLTLAPGPDVVPVAGDFDGDGRSDAGFYRTSTGEWRILTSSSGYASAVTRRPGAGGGVPVPGDYDGDGLADAAVFDALTGTWVVQLSSSANRTIALTLGRTDDIPVPADYDGDGRTDPAIYQPSTGVWQVLTSSSNFTSLITRRSPGTGVPVAGDYDGDGLSDFALYDSSTGTWSIAMTGGAVVTIVWGSPNDVPVPADYDGDGRTDPAIYQSNGTWMILLSGDNYSTNSILSLGGEGAVPLVQSGRWR